MSVGRHNVALPLGARAQQEEEEEEESLFKAEDKAPRPHLPDRVRDSETVTQSHDRTASTRLPSPSHLRLRHAGMTLSAITAAAARLRQ